MGNLPRDPIEIALPIATFTPMGLFFIGIVVVWLWRFHRRRQQEAAQQLRGNHATDRNDGLAVIHVTDGVPLHYDGSDSTGQSIEDTSELIRHLPQASAAVVPARSGVTVAYHTRGRFFKRKRFHVLEATPDGANPFLPPTMTTSTAAQARTGTVVVSDEDEKPGEERQGVPHVGNPFTEEDYGTAVYYSRPASFPVSRQTSETEECTDSDGDRTGGDSVLEYSDYSDMAAP